jgi:polyisoprenoid-binding protein YceI
MSLRTIVPAMTLSLIASLVAVRAGSAADMYAVDTVHSSIVFRVKHMNTAYFWGRFNNLAGSFSLDEANPAASQFEFQVKVDSVDTGNTKRDTHLKSPDFFNAVQFPVIAFTSQTVKKTASGYDVIGELTLHGVTKPVSVQVIPTGNGKGPSGRPIAGLEATLNFKRSDFGMTNMVGPVGDDVLVNVGVEGSRK